MVAETEIYELYFAPGSYFEKWTIIREIGCGALGKVFLAFMGKNPTEGSYGVLKVMPTNYVSRSLFQKFLAQEYKFIANLDDHVNIVRLLPQDRHSVWKGGSEIFYLTLEYCPGGNLEQFRRHYPQGRMLPVHAFLCLEQLVRGLQYAHEKQIIHGDICGENILLMRPHNLKIADFGLARIGSDRRGLHGKRLLYQAPELLNNDCGGIASDMWSLGVLFYRLLTGNFPFRGKNEQELYCRIRTSTIRWPDFLKIDNPQTIEATLVYFVERLLAFDPKRRPDCCELSAVLHKCRSMVTHENLQNFEQQFYRHISQMDQRPRSPVLTSESSSANDSGSETTIDASEDEWLQQQKKCSMAHQSYNHLTALACGLVFLALIGIISVSIPWKKLFKVFTNKPTVEIKIRNKVDEFNTWSIEMVLRNPLGERISLPKIKYKGLQIVLHYRNTKSSGKNKVNWEQASTGTFTWRLPDNWHSQKIILCAKVYDNDKLYALSREITLKLQGSYQERQTFRQAQIMAKKWGNNAKRYAKIAQCFGEYRLRHPQGVFYERATQQFHYYQEKAIVYQLKSLLKKSPRDIKKIVAISSSLIEKYPTSNHVSLAKKNYNAYRQLLIPKTYKVTLGQVHLRNKKSRLLDKNIDSYVRVYVNKRNVFTSSVIKDNDHPKWDVSFEIIWKTGDVIKVELWDKNIWPDKKLFAIKNSGAFAICLLSNTIDEKACKMEFSSTFPQNFCRGVYKRSK